LRRSTWTVRLAVPLSGPASWARHGTAATSPSGGTALDPFAGSGTTGEAAHTQGFNAILIEREKEYQVDMKRRLADGPLFLTLMDE
jgi:site-specific DNA-methyltransferase (adenine-specific)